MRFSRIAARARPSGRGSGERPRLATKRPEYDRALVRAVLARGFLALVVFLLVAAVPSTARPGSLSDSGATDDATAAALADVAAARALFEANLEAIRQRDRDAYLACYLDSERLARTGFEGPALGFDGLAASAGEAWPEVFEAQDLRLVPVAPGVVYGTYRYRVRYAEGGDRMGLSERFFLDTPDGWRIAVTTAFEAPPGTPPPPRALVGATLIDGTGAPPVSDAVVVMRNGRIDCSGTREACPVPEGVGTVDLTGRWITPGLIDAHVHFSQTGWADGRPDFIDVRDRFPYEEVVADLHASPETFYRSFLCSGVTAVFDVGGYPWTWELRSAAEQSSEAPHVAAAGPLLSTWDFWLNTMAERQFVYIGDETMARDGVRYLASRGTDAVKVWFIVRDDEELPNLAAAVRAVGEEAAGRGVPLIVHATGLAEAKEAVRAGASLLVHSVWDQPVDQELIDFLLEQGTIYCPTLTVTQGYLRLAEAVVSGTVPEIDDPNHCVAPETRARVAATAEIDPSTIDAASLERRRRAVAERSRVGAANLAALAAAGVPVAMGTDAGNPLTLHGPSVYAELEAMEAAGLSPMAVLVAATATAARAMGRGADLGTLEPGKIADLLVLAADPTLSTTAFRSLTHITRAGVLRPASELRSLHTAGPPDQP